MNFSELNTRAEEFFETWTPRVEKTKAFAEGAKALLEAADALINSEAFRSLYQWCKNRVYEIKDRLTSALKTFFRGFDQFMGEMYEWQMSLFRI